jgi:formylglycine-generating enzyme required for sulfatase activity
MFNAVLVISILATSPRGMVSVPAGSYRPLFASNGLHAHVAAFAIDREPVTRGEFLRFVRANEMWRKSAIRSVFAGRSYLEDWPNDLDAGNGAALAEPVRSVSWFAARAYCEAGGKRLPTTDEWEYVAAADETRRDATSDPSFIQRLISIYTTHRGGFRNVYGVENLHAPLWEWTDDFNDVVLSDDSRGTGSGVDARDHSLYCAGAALGAADPSNYPAFLRSAVRSGLTGRSATSHLGFRCAL